MKKQRLFSLASLLLVVGSAILVMAYSVSQADVIDPSGAQAIRALLIFGGSMIAVSIVIFAYFMNQ